ncbi:retinol dehydrogenase 12-like [Oculina patagonica]
MANNAVIVLSVLTAGLAFVYYRLRCYFAGGVCKNAVSMKGKTVIITGANTGLGKQTALELARRQARVILACRSLERGQKAAEEIRSKVKGAEVVVKSLDLSSLESVRKFAEEILKEEARLDVLINNAGLSMDPPTPKTQDGFEIHYGVNHLGHFLLTNLLLDLLEKSAPSRIVVVASSLAKFARIDFDNIHGEKSKDVIGRRDHKTGPYAQSKLANMLFAHELNKRLPDGVTVNSLCPGLCWTELFRHSSLSLLKKLFLYPIATVAVKRAWEGAQTIIYCATEEKLDQVSGATFADCDVKEFPPHTRDDGVARKLWELSEALTQ